MALLVNQSFIKVVWKSQQSKPLSKNQTLKLTISCRPSQANSTLPVKVLLNVLPYRNFSLVCFHG